MRLTLAEAQASSAAAAPPDPVAGKLEKSADKAPHLPDKPGHLTRCRAIQIKPCQIPGPNVVSQPAPPRTPAAC